MAVEKINLNNELIEPDDNGVVDIGTLLREHQPLDEYLPRTSMRFVTAQEWEILSASADQDVFYFVGIE